jgi:hypothetical protein
LVTPRQSPQQLVRALHDIGLADTTIARLICCSPGTIWRIRHGKESGRNLAPYLENVALLVEANESGYRVRLGEPVR